MPICPLCRSRPLSAHLITILLAPLLLSGCGKDAPPSAPVAPEIPVVTVERRDVPRIMEFVGQTKGAVDAEIRARVAGQVESVEFAEGREVTAGQLLYTIDPAPFKAKEAEAKAHLAEAETRLGKAESDLRRIRPLAAINAVSKRDLDNALALEAAAKSGVDAAQAALEAVQIELGYTRITAPVSGTIGLSQAKVGEFVGQPPNPVVLATVSQLDPIHVRFAVNEKDYLYFARQGQRADQSGQPREKQQLRLVLADGSEHAESGELVSTDAAVSPVTGSLTVEASFPNPGKIVRPGQFAKIRVVAETLPQVVTIPARAIRDLQGQAQVIVITAQNIAEIRAVQLGVEFDGQRVVQSGLDGGERIATDGLNRIRAGLPVRPVEAKAGAAGAGA